MSRPLRLEIAGGLYHVTSRGDRREDIYHDDADRDAWLATLAQTCERYNWLIHAWCQMSNHYHVIIETDIEPGPAGEALDAIAALYNNRVE